jgi:hypothetical protein
MRYKDDADDAIHDLNGREFGYKRRPLRIEYAQASPRPAPPRPAQPRPARVQGQATRCWPTRQLTCSHSLPCFSACHCNTLAPPVASDAAV